MNKMVAVSGIIIILLSTVCGVLFYQIGDMQSQNSELQNEMEQLENQVSELELENLELQNQIDELEAYIKKISSAILVQITEFTVIDQEYVGFVFYEGNVTVTVQNFGTSDVDGLTLWIKDTTVEGGLNETIQLGTLKVGEPQTIKVKLRWDLQRDLVATVMLDDMYLDTCSTTTTY